MDILGLADSQPTCVDVPSMPSVSFLDAEAAAAKAASAVLSSLIIDCRSENILSESLKSKEDDTYDIMFLTTNWNDVDPTESDDGDIVVTDKRWWRPGSGGGGGGSGSDSSGGPEPSRPGPADLARTSGNNGCHTTREGFNHAIYSLMATRTGKALIENTYGDTRLTFNFVIFQEGEINTYDSYDRQRNVINWDAYSAAYGTNPDGSVWENSAIVALAHELAHYKYGANEAMAIEMGNRVARELKALGRPDHSTTNRVGHSGNQRSTTHVSDTQWGLRPPCDAEAW